MFEKKYIVYISYFANNLKEELGRFRTKRKARDFSDKKNAELGDFGRVYVEEEK